MSQGVCGKPACTLRDLHATRIDNRDRPVLPRVVVEVPDDGLGERLVDARVNHAGSGAEQIAARRGEARAGNGSAAGCGWGCCRALMGPRFGFQAVLEDITGWERLAPELQGERDATARAAFTSTSGKWGMSRLYLFLVSCPQVPLRAQQCPAFHCCSSYQPRI
jgi:hypothetical protein